MADSEKIKRLNKFGQTIIKEIKAQQKKLGLTSSGKSAKSLRVVLKPDAMQIRGASYFFQQIKGRKPGKFPPLQEIAKWVAQKPVMLKGGITQKQVAFLIARKIAGGPYPPGYKGSKTGGTQIYQGKREGLDIQKIFQNIKEDLLKEIALSESQDILVEITGKKQG